MDQYLVRRFRDGDEEEVSRLFNEVYQVYGGFVPRTVEYWRWCCLKRPDVRPDGIFLVCDGENGKVCGYAVVGSTGNVWEFCAGGDRRRIGSILLAEVVKHLETVGVSSVNVNVPGEFGLDRIFEQQGFARVPPSVMFVSTLSPKKLLLALVADKRGDFDEEIAFELEGVPLGVERTVSVRVRSGEVTVVDGFSQSASIKVKMGFIALMSVLFKGSGVYGPFFRGKIRVKPFWKVGKLLSFLRMARSGDSWFWPLSDFG
jgi:hypothetical protein